MEEVFVEKIIKRKTGIKGSLLRVLSILVVILVFFLTLRLTILGITITILMGYLAYLVWVYTSIEYEYSFLNGELTIDKIMGQRKRKKVDCFDIKKAEIVAPVSSDDIVRRNDIVKTLDYSSGYKSNKLYSIIINNGAGNVQVIFEPDDRIIEAMYHIRPSIVKKV